MGNLSQATQGQQMQRLDPSRELKDMVRRSWPQIQRVIGNNLDPDALLQYCISAINREPMLAECTPVSVLSCFMQCAALGLKPSNVDGLGQAYILPYGNKNYKTGQKDATFIIGFKGMLKLLENSGIYAQPRAVYKDDGITLTLGDDGNPVIKCPESVNLDADHSVENLSFVYLSVALPNGGRYADYMSAKDLASYRERFAPRSKYKGNQITGPWATDFVAMGLKTLIRRSFKYLPVTVEAKKSTVVDETTPDYSDVFRPVIDDEPQAAIEAAPEAQEPEAAEATQTEEAHNA